MTSEKIIDMAIDDMPIDCAIKVINNLSSVTIINFGQMPKDKFNIMLKNINTIN